MMKYIYIAATLILLLPSMVMAQDGVLQPREQTGKTLKSDGILQSQEEIKKKEFLNKFYDRCTAVPDKNQSMDSQSDMCICETLHMEKFLNADEIEIMATGKGKGYVRKEVLYLDVYAPCFEFPARDMALNECYNNSRVRAIVSTQNAYKGTCQCAAQKAAEYFREYARPQLAAIMENSPVLDDPLGVLIKGFDYIKYMETARKKCLDTYQVKWDDYYRQLQTQEQKK